MGYWNKMIESMDEDAGYKKIAVGVVEDRQWILYHSVELGFAVHGSWMSQAESDFAEDLIGNNIIDDMMLAVEMVPMLKQFGNTDGWAPEWSDDVRIVFDVFQNAGTAARQYVDEALKNFSN